MDNLSANDELKILKGASLADSKGAAEIDTARAARKVAEVVSRDDCSRRNSGSSATRWIVTLAAAACLLAFAWIFLFDESGDGVPGTFNQVDSYHAAIDSVCDTAAVGVEDFEIIAIDE